MENVLTCSALSRAIAATTALESTPPDSSAPIGTSLCSRRRVAFRSLSRISSQTSASPTCG
jgi:hypothetical protein